METPSSLQHNALFQPFPRNPATLSGSYLWTLQDVKCFCLGWAVLCLFSTKLQAGSWFRRKEHLPSLNSQALLESLSSSYWHIWLFSWVCFQSLAAAAARVTEIPHAQRERKKNKKIPAPCSQCFLPQATISASPRPSFQAVLVWFLEWNLGKASIGIHPEFLGSWDHPAAACFSRIRKINQEYPIPNQEYPSFSQVKKCGEKMGCLSQMSQGLKLVQMMAQG